MNDHLGPAIPGERPERADDNDTLEYRSRGRRVARGATAARDSRGYWIGVDAPVAPEARHRPAGGGTAGRRRPGRSRRRILGFMVLSVVVLVALAIAAALTFTGDMVVPGVSERLFPIKYQEEIARVAAEYGQDPYLIAAMVKTESGYDAGAESEHAVGLMQLRPETAAWIVADLDSWKGDAAPVLTDPSDSLELGACYLAYLGHIYGDGSLAALAAYNGGPGNVDKWIEAAGGQSALGAADIPFKETKQYVERVERFRALYVQIYPDVFSQTAK